MTGHVLCVDPSSWDAFVALGAALTHRGNRVVRIVGRDLSAAQRARVTLERAAFSRTLEVLDESAPPSQMLKPLLAEMPGVNDVQSTDRIAAALAETPEWRQRSDLHRVHASDFSDSMLYDKLHVTNLAARAGVPVPTTWAALGEAPTDKPLAVKARLGSGGDAVLLLPPGSDVEQAGARLGSGDEVFAQLLLPGEIWNVGGVADMGRVLVAAAYRALPAVDDPGGPSAFAEPHNRPDLLDLAERIVTALGYRGPFCADFVQDADGLPHLIDFNPRWFGAWPALQASGVDLIGAYLHVVAGQPMPVPRRLTTGRAIPTGPRASSKRAPFRSSARVVSSLGRELGPRWRAVAVVEALSNAIR